MNPAVLVVGEGMLELSRSNDTWRLGYGGDTLNSAIHLARMGLNTGYFTALGPDPFSQELRAAWSNEGLDTSFILTDHERKVGIYAIRTSELGERSFVYWRDQAAAKRMFDLPGVEQLVTRAEKARLLVFSLTSLAILPPKGRRSLLALAKRVRSAGGEIAFDGNYRAILWSSVQEACDLRNEAIASCTFGLPTLTDEQALVGHCDPNSVAEHWRSLGAAEVVVKLGEQGCFLGGRIVPTPFRVDPVDTSGAGDAFNAGYLAARLRGGAPEPAAIVGHRLAAWVVSRAGAIPPPDSMAPYQ